MTSFNILQYQNFFIFIDTVRNKAYSTRHCIKVQEIHKRNTHIKNVTCGCEPSPLSDGCSDFIVAIWFLGSSGPSITNIKETSENRKKINIQINNNVTKRNYANIEFHLHKPKELCFVTSTFHRQIPLQSIQFGSKTSELYNGLEPC